jgi:hypothetical protein
MRPVKTGLPLQKLGDERMISPPEESQLIAMKFQANDACCKWLRFVGLFFTDQDSILTLPHAEYGHPV